MTKEQQELLQALFTAEESVYIPSGKALVALDPKQMKREEAIRTLRNVRNIMRKMTMPDKVQLVRDFFAGNRWKEYASQYTEEAAQAAFEWVEAAIEEAIRALDS